MQGFYTILLLVASNIFMTCAWYGHLKMKQQFSWFEHLPLIGVVLFSWFLAFFEYCFQVPANRMGFRDNGGPFNLIQLKVIQEVITLVVFVGFSSIAFKGESFKWNHALAFLFLVAAVYLVFKKYDFSLTSNQAETVIEKFGISDRVKNVLCHKRVLRVASK